MPLSEHEQRLLSQMEQALYAEDPKFASSLRTVRGRGSRGRAAGGVLAFLGGLGMVVGGVASTFVAIGVAGFVVMLLGAVLVYSAFGAGPAPEAEAGEKPAASSPPKAGNSDFMSRMEDRWRRRNEEGR